MSNYNSYIGNLASDLQDRNMQNHLRSTIGDVSVNSRNLREKLIDYEYKELIRLIYLTALGNRDRYLDGEILKKHFYDSEDELIPIFEKMNDDSLNDPNFTKALNEKRAYIKKIGSEKDDILFYIPGTTSSRTHDVFMDILYLPSMEDKPNRFRINVKEKSINEYPYLNFSVDIYDDGSIKYIQPMIIDKSNNDESSITRTPTDMSSTHISFNKSGVMAIRDVFMDIFDKTGIKENNHNIKM